MTAAEILKSIKPLGTEGYKKILLNHGVKEPVFGVKIEYLKKIQKQVKKDYQLALDLFESGNYDAMYLAGLIADDAKMTKGDLRKWVVKSSCGALSEYTVSWVAAGSNHGWELAMEWIESDDELVATSGWSTLAGVVALKDDAELDQAELKRLLKRVERTIHDAPNRVRYVMNGFVIAVGSYVKGLTETALKTAEKIGVVSVDMGNTACKVPAAAEYINKVRQRGTIGKKRKTVKC